MEIVIYDKDKNHNKTVKDVCFRFTFRERMEWELHVFELEKELRGYMEKNPLKKMILAGVETGKAEFYQELSKHFLVLMGSSPEELLRLVRPGFRPSGLLLKPVEKKLLEQLLFELKKQCRIERKEEDMFFFRVKSQEYLVPKNKILFFESRSKKIVLRTDSQEMEFYDTLDRLQGELGRDFIRVHKSFLVNLSRVSMVHFAGKTVHFSDGTFVQVSRTHKGELEKEWKKRKEIS